jgi:hypothetical protein
MKVCSLVSGDAPYILKVEVVSSSETLVAAYKTTTIHMFTAMKKQNSQMCVVHGVFTGKVNNNFLSVPTWKYDTNLNIISYTITTTGCAI